MESEPKKISQETTTTKTGLLCLRSAVVTVLCIRSRFIVQAISIGLPMVLRLRSQFRSIIPSNGAGEGVIVWQESAERHGRWSSCPERIRKWMVVSSRLESGFPTARTKDQPPCLARHTGRLGKRSRQFGPQKYIILYRGILAGITRAATTMIVINEAARVANMPGASGRLDPERKKTLRFETRTPPKDFEKLAAVPLSVPADPNKTRTVPCQFPKTFAYTKICSRRPP